MLSQAPAAETRLRSTEVSLGVTGVGTGYTFRGGRSGDFTFGPDLKATAVVSGYTVNVGFLHSVPFDSSGVTASSTLTVRLGYTGARFQLLAGAVLQLAPEAQPRTQVLPSLRAEAKFTEKLRFAVALFENHGLVPVRFTWEQERFFVGYVAPLGLTAGVRARISEELSLDARAVVFRLYNTEVAMLTLSGVVGAPR